MIIKKIILENYGLFAGKVEFDLSPKSNISGKKNVILIGGKNGVGKTTLLDALRLVFYGKSILGNRVSQNDYESFLRRQIHQNDTSILTNTFARVSIDFDHVAMGQYKNYTVERSWSIENKKLKEYLKIFTEGILESCVTDDFWKGFIEEIIPERLSNLFFFDGEKIQEIAKESSRNSVLGDAIKTLLGLDIVERLKADLNIYKTKELKQNSLNNFKRRWDEIDIAIKKLKAEISNQIESLAANRSKIDGNLSDIKKWDQKLNSEGGHFALQRELLQKQKNECIKKSIAIEDIIKEGCIGIYPLSLCPSINNSLKKQIKKESDFSHQKIIKKEIANIQAEILALIEGNNSIEDSEKNKLKESINDLIKPKINYDLSNTHEILQLSDHTINNYLEILNQAEQIVAKTVSDASLNLEKNYNKIRTIEKELAKSPNDNQIQPLFEELSLLNQRQGELKSQEKQIEAEINRKEYDLKKRQWDLAKLIDKQKIHNQIEDRIQMIKLIDIVLNSYYQKLKQAKINQLNNNFSNGFNQLMSKQLVERIQIDPKNFNVSLFKNHDIPIAKESFSSGERQLFAIAMLWSLAKTSGRPLPVIIDTPLGRLDSVHRKNLINNYFPKASHQVILLSTDTEVDNNLYQELKPYLSHCYHLEYDKKNKKTKPVEGYFWEKKNLCQS